MSKAKEMPVNQFGHVPIVWDAARERWRLSVFAAGKRRRTWHKTEDEAQKAWAAHCGQIAQHGRQSLAYDAAVHAEYTEAKRLASGRDLRDVARFFVEAHGAGEEVTVAEAARRFLAHKGGQKLSDRHGSGLKSHVEKFAADHGVKSVRAITGNDVLAWIASLSQSYAPRTVRNYFGSLANFLNWCKRRKLVQASPASDIHDSDLPVVPARPKGVLSVDQAAAMMAWLAEHRPHFVAWHALQLFAGLRNAEAGRMRWEWIDLERKTITMPGWAWDNDEAERIVKTGDDWVLHDLPENLWLWLRKFRGKAADADTIQAPFRSSEEIMRCKYFPKLPHPIPKWPQNAMRHTFCTMLISLHGDAAKVANWSRHTNARQLYKSYVAKLVPKLEAERFLAIAP